MYSLHDISITGLPIKEVLECEIESRIGEHSTLMLLAYTDEEDALFELPDCQEVTVYLGSGEEKKILFSGIVTEIQMSEYGQIKTVQVNGKSRSWLMDRIKYSRSFQNIELTYQALVKEVLSSYENKDKEKRCGIICTGADQKIENIFIQYEETDWAFLKRVLSVAGLVLTPDSRKEGIKLYVGIPNLTKAEPSYRILGIDKDMESYYLLKANGSKVNAADFTCYQIASEQILGICESVAIQGKNLAVFSCQYVFKNQEMLGIYGLQGSKGLKPVASYPMHLIGVALTGKVVRVSGTKIQAALEIDKDKTERAVYWFPFSTLSASPDGSGWYCMPEEGDDVRIYFPSKQEKEAVALSAVSNYEAPKTGEEDRMGDPNSRYLRTKAGQELALAPDHIKLSCGKQSSVVIDTDGKVTVQAQTMVRAEAQTSVSLHAEEALNIHVKEQFIAQSLDGGQIIFDSGNILIRGTQVNFD
ncbi:MAG: contractile injection system protein, VgrG/Pvc8 family [Acetatifactor sp.]